MAINFLSSIDIAGTASLSSVSNDNSSYTGILVWDGGLLKYRTKSQLLTDIGGDINNYVSSISFDTTNGILSLPRTGLSTLTVDLDGRYALESGNVDGSGTTNFVAKWLDSNTIQNSIIFDDGTNVRINATNAAVNIGTTISTTPVGGHPNTGAGTLIVGGKTNSGYNYQPGVITLINQNPSIAAGADTGVIQFVGKDDATSGYASANIKAFTAAAAGTGNSGGGIITLGTSPGYGGPVERFRINQNGNIGIGTTSPNATLDIENSTGVTVDINSSSGDGQFRFQDNGVTKWSIGRDNTQQDFVISSSAGLNTDPVVVLNHSTENVGIGTTTPGAKLEVAGDALINDLTVGKGAGTSSLGNTVFGKTALNNITSGLRNVAIGNEALLDNTTGNYNVAIGYQSLENNLANNNVAIGVQALERVETAGNNTAVGYLTLGLTLGANNTAIGYGAGYLRVGGTNGNSIGSVFIGSLTKSNGLNSENEIVIGTGAESAGSNTVVLGNDLITSTRLKGDVIVANGDVGIGTTSPSYKLQVAGGINAGGKVTYSKAAGSLDTTGYAVAGLTTSSNGQSAGFTFTCFGHTGKYQKIVYSCWNAAGTWNTSKVIDEGTNDFNIEASANGTTITFTFKSRSGSKSYTPRVTVEATGTAINNTYA